MVISVAIGIVVVGVVVPANAAVFAQLFSVVGVAIREAIEAVHFLSVNTVADFVCLLLIFSFLRFLKK